MSVWVNKYIQPNKWSRPQSKLTTVKKIIIHWTANSGASAENHYRYFNNLTGRYASAHFFVDRKDKLCIIPLDEITYQANDVQKYVSGKAYRGVSALLPNANFRAIGIEMCVEKDGTIHAETIANAVAVATELCKKYGLTEKDIVRHYDVTAKSCPTPFITAPSKFDAFKNAVKESLAGKVTQVSNTIKESVYYTTKVDNVKAKTDITVYKDVEFKTKLGVISKGDIVAVEAVEKTKKGTPRFKTKYGYITTNKSYVAKITNPIGVATVKVSDLNIRKSNSFESTVVEVAKKGKEYEVIKESNGMYQVGNGKWFSANSKYSTYKKGKIDKSTKNLVLKKEKSKEEAAKQKLLNLRITYTKIIQKGDKGELVISLQKALNALGYSVGTVDGIFGNDTLTAVKNFQKKYTPKEVDGIAGKNTISKINEALEK